MYDNQAGEKDDLVQRVSLHVRCGNVLLQGQLILAASCLMCNFLMECSSRGLNVDGTDPFELKPAELRKACAQRGNNGLMI